MAEEKEKKVESGKALLNLFLQKKKQEPRVTYEELQKVVFGRSCDHHGLMWIDKTLHVEPANYKMDAVSLQQKTEQVETWAKTISHLKDTIVEKDGIIESLETQNKVLLQGTGDHSSSNTRELDRIKELQTMVDARDTYISQLSDSLQKRSEELEKSLCKEKELTREIQVLQQEIRNKTKQTELRLSESYTETVQYKAKVELLSNQMQEYTNSIQSLRKSLENNNKLLEARQDELAAKSKAMEKYKTGVTEDIKNLMRQVEILNNDVSMKENELTKSKKEVETIRNELEAQFGAEITALKSKLETKYKEDVKKVELLYDSMLLQHIRKSDTAELKSIEKCNDLEAEISNCRLSYEKEIKAYTDDLQSLLEKSKSTEEQLLCELEKHKQEAVHYRNMVSNFENKLSEEFTKIKNECHFELNKHQQEIETFKASYKQERIDYYEEELESLSKKLKDYAICEARKEEELELYKNQLQEKDNQINDLVKEMDRYKELCVEKDEQMIHLETEINRYKQSCGQLQETIYEFKRIEFGLSRELEISKSKLDEYEGKVAEYNSKFQYESSQFNEKYQTVVHTLQEQIQHLMNELERKKSSYENEILNYTSIVNEQQNQITNLEAKLRYLYEMNKNSVENTNEQKRRDLDPFYNQSDLNALKEKLIYMNKSEESTNKMLIGLLKQLKEVKFCMKSLLNHSEPDKKKNIEVTQRNENMNHETLIRELEQSVCDILTISQQIHDNSSVDNNKHSIENIVTSTPHVKNHCYSKNNVDPENFADSDTDSISTWIRRCELLESENINLTKKLDVLSSSLKEMEYCLVLATQESSSFNKKCQSLDSKITELENLKLSEFMLKKENDELKERLSFVEKTEQSLRKELEMLHENNLKIEEMYNKNLLDIHTNLCLSDSNTQLNNVLENLKIKCEELITLKSEINSLQKIENELKARVTDIQLKYDKFQSKYDFLTAELSTKKKELDDVWEDRNKLSIENKILQTKLISVQVNKFSEGSNNHSEELSDCHKNKNLTKSEVSVASPVLITSQSERQQPLELQPSTYAWMNFERSGPNTISLVEHIENELQLLDQQVGESLDYHMPTIPEEEDQDEESPYLWKQEGPSVRQVLH